MHIGFSIFVVFFYFCSLNLVLELQSIILIIVCGKKYFFIHNLRELKLSNFKNNLENLEKNVSIYRMMF